MSRLSRAETILWDLGITDPKEIELEAIAFTLGVQVKYRALEGCEARIVGSSDKAIITVNSSSSNSRRRFSIAHELGHWIWHRGRTLACSEADISPSSQKAGLERTADAFAADLLMPNYIMTPTVKSLTNFSFAAIDSLATQFQVSRTACAIRLIEREHVFGLLVCHTKRGRKWFRRSPSVPERWFPKDDLDAASSAFDIAFGSAPDDARSKKIGADAWFDRAEARRYDIHEQSVRIGNGEVLSLLTFINERMLEDR